MAREERKKRITEQRENQILDAALTVFSEKGFGAATMPDIAESAGLAVGSIYNYFPNKRELFVAVIRHFILNAPLMMLIDEFGQSDLQETFSKVMNNRLDLLESSSIAHLPFLMAEVQRDPELKELWNEELLQPFLKRMENQYQKLSEGKTETGIDPAVMVRLAGGFILGFLMFRIMEGDRSPVLKLPREDVVRNMADFMMFGIMGNLYGEEAGREEHGR